MGTRLRAAQAAILATAILAVAGTAASASPGRAAGGVKFVITYSGSVNGTWHQSDPVELGIKCIGDDLTGSFTSSIRPGKKKVTARLYREFGRGRLYVEILDGVGLASSNRTAQGWYMKYSGGQCQQVQKDESGCGAHTFATQAGLDYLRNDRRQPTSMYHLDWLLEPMTLYCDDGIVYDPKDQFPTGRRRPSSTP